MSSSSASSNTNNANANAAANSITGRGRANVTPISIAPVRNATVGNAVGTNYIRTNTVTRRQNYRDSDSDDSMSDIPVWHNVMEPVNMALHMTVRSRRIRVLGNRVMAESDDYAYDYVVQSRFLFCTGYNRGHISHLVIEDDNPSRPNDTADLTDISMEDTTDSSSDASNSDSSAVPNSDSSTVANSDSSIVVDSSDSSIADRIARRQWFQLPNHIKMRYYQTASVGEQKAITYGTYQREKLMQDGQETTEKAVNSVEVQTEEVNEEPMAVDDETKQEDASAEGGSENPDDEPKAERNQEEDQEEKKTNNVNHETETETENNIDLQKEDEQQEMEAPDAENNVTPMNVDERLEPELPSTSSSCANRKRKGSPNRGGEPDAKRRRIETVPNETNVPPVPSLDSVNSSSTVSPSPNPNEYLPEDAGYYAAWLRSPPEN
ncbi:hypothetical protein AWZ03_013568 [Drosophila navojoa]|uniref:Uncharacterized protein n=1 Tax=Drosophila navojoa TaxID=7232 RepID=A0A484ATR5_DRONA|nr:hypothetical protein AWZ03_013568 [Drosophila navojoa]